MYERDKHEADNHKKKPSKYLLRSDHMPYNWLGWIDPDSCVGRNILSEPYK